MIDSLGLDPSPRVDRLFRLIGCIVGGIISGFFPTGSAGKYPVAGCRLVCPVSWVCLSGISFSTWGTDVGVLIMLNLYRFWESGRAGLCDRSNLYREIAPAHIRGRLVSWYQFAIIFSQLVVYIVTGVLPTAGPLSGLWTGDGGTCSLQEPSLRCCSSCCCSWFPKPPLGFRKDDQRAFNILEKSTVPKKAKKFWRISSFLCAKKRPAIFFHGKTVVIVGFCSVFQQFVGSMSLCTMLRASLKAWARGKMLRCSKPCHGACQCRVYHCGHPNRGPMGKKTLLISGSVRNGGWNV